jgi:dTDP-glucose 4,6-dehydratase
MTIVVTGGAGFIGNNFISYMLSKYPRYRIICVDKLTYAGKYITLQRFVGNSNFRFIKADICDSEQINGIFKEEHPDVVINFAAESHVDRAIKDPFVFLRTNVLGTEVLMDACRKYGVARFHQISTDEVYGGLPQAYTNVRVSENAELRPGNPYSASKAAADLLAMSYYRTYDLPVSISRCSNNYGPYQFPEKLIPLTITNALQDKCLPVYGTGQNLRDWIYVEDHCSAIDFIIHKGSAGEIYNISANSQMKNLDVVKSICKNLNKSEDLIRFVQDRKGHDFCYGVDSSKICQELHWKPKVEFEDGLQKTVQWYVANRCWWEER